jgi:hypothetical protein
MNLRAALPDLLPLAIAWAETRAREIDACGGPLDVDGIAIARAVGVAHPERVRVASLRELPLPEQPDLRAAAQQVGLLGPNIAAMTLGHGIMIVSGLESRRLLAHELRHVRQYEDAGSIAAYLPLYLGQIVEFGYADAPFERDARAHELA